MAKSSLNRGSFGRSSAPVAAEQELGLVNVDTVDVVLAEPSQVAAQEPKVLPVPELAPKPASVARVYQVGDEYLLDGKKGTVIVVLKDTFKVRWPDKSVSFIKK